MSILLSIFILVVVLALILYPLFRGNRGELFQEVRSAAPSLAHEKEALLNTLGEIEFDYHMNKLSEEDYRSLKNNYAEASAAIAEAEQAGTCKVPPKGHLQAKKAAKRRSQAAPQVSVAEIEQEIEAELQALDSQAPVQCHRCGTTLIDTGQEYCHACGERQF